MSVEVRDGVGESADRAALEAVYRSPGPERTHSAGMTTRTSLPGREYDTIIGTVTRNVWLDDTSLTADSPHVTVTVVDGR